MTLQVTFGNGRLKLTLFGNRVYRGGLYYNSGTKYPALYRDSAGATYVSSTIGFRVALYIKPAICGDANGDGKLSMLDINTIEKYTKGNITVKINLKAADVNGDGLVDENDTELLTNYLSGIKGATLSCRDL